MRIHEFSFKNPVPFEKAILYESNQIKSTGDCTILFLQHLELLQKRFVLYESLIQKYFCMNIYCLLFVGGNILKDILLILYLKIDVYTMYSNVFQYEIHMYP